MELTQRKTGSVTVLSIKGKINIETSPDLKREVLRIADTGVQKIYLDFSNVDFVNSSGLGSLINLLKELRKKDVAMVIINPSNFIRSLFTLTHLDEIFETYDSIEDALKTAE